MNNVGNDRVQQAIARIDQRQAALKIINKSTNDSRETIKERLREYEKIKREFKNVTGEERSSLRVLRGEIKKMEKDLHGGRIGRIIGRLRRRVENFVDKQRNNMQIRRDNTSGVSQSNQQRHAQSSVNKADDGRRQNISLTNGQDKPYQKQLEPAPLRNIEPTRHAITPGVVREGNFTQKKDLKVNLARQLDKPQKKLKHRLS
jgi:hypothetical protein